MAITFLYLNTKVPDGLMHNVLAAGRFSDVKIQKSTLGTTMRANIPSTFAFEETTPEELEATLRAHRKSRIILWPAHIAVLNVASFHLLLEKLQYATCPVRIHVATEHIYAGPANLAGTEDEDRALPLEREDYLLPLQSMADLQRLFSTNIHSRHFNQVIATGDTISKSSANIAKIKSEYQFLSTVPADMQAWFVPVSDYVETKTHATYTMPKLPMLDASVRFINGNLRGLALTRFIRDVGLYLDAAHDRNFPADADTYSFIADKCLARMKELQHWPHYSALNSFVRTHTDFPTLEHAFTTLIALLEKAKPTLLAAGQTFSHGDLCLSNMLYDDAAGILQMIDPRGGPATASYRSPYYDLAKLSHSLLGGYDHIVNGIATITFADDMQATLNLGIEDPQELQTAFMGLVTRTNFSYPLIRLVEASLFLSMLPLHTESPRKVHILTLRGLQILREAQALQSTYTHKRLRA